MDAALTLADTSGFRGVTIRALAAQVGVPPMTLYAHFSNKERLLDGMFERALSRLFPVINTSTWQEELIAASKHARKLLMEHPHWLPLLTRVTVPLTTLGFFDGLMKQMLRYGIGKADALHAYSSVMSFTLGIVLVERMMAGHGEVSVPIQRLKLLRSMLPDLPAKTYEGIVRVAPQFDAWTFNDVFELGLRSLVAGIEMNCFRPRPGRAHA
jgi:AcrR family transcriptional regulator